MSLASQHPNVKPGLDLNFKWSTYEDLCAYLVTKARRHKHITAPVVTFSLYQSKSNHRLLAWTFKYQETEEQQANVSEILSHLWLVELPVLRVVLKRVIGLVQEDDAVVDEEGFPSPNGDER